MFLLRYLKTVFVLILSAVLMLIFLYIGTDPYLLMNHDLTKLSKKVLSISIKNGPEIMLTSQVKLLNITSIKEKEKIYIGRINFAGKAKKESYAVYLVGNDIYVSNHTGRLFYLLLTKDEKEKIIKTFYDSYTSNTISAETKKSGDL